LLLLAKYGLNLGALSLFKFTAAMNGGVMFLYSLALVYINRFRLPPAIRIPNWRLAILVLTVLFFGFFTAWAGYDAARQIAAAWTK